MMSLHSSINNKLLIADTGPLLALARINQLHLLQELFDEVCVTEAVWAETQAKPAFSDAQAVKLAREQAVFVVVPNPVPSGHFESLDAGEQSALQIALERQAMVLLDETKGRAQAKAHAIPIIGCVGVLLLAKRRGHIEFVAPLLESLSASGYHLGESLLKRAKALANE